MSSSSVTTLRLPTLDLHSRFSASTSRSTRKITAIKGDLICDVPIKPSLCCCKTSKPEADERGKTLFFHYLIESSPIAGNMAASLYTIDDYLRFDQALNIINRTVKIEKDIPLLRLSLKRIRYHLLQKEIIKVREPLNLRGDARRLRDHFLSDMYIDTAPHNTRYNRALIFLKLKDCPVGKQNLIMEYIETNLWRLNKKLVSKDEIRSLLFEAAKCYEYTFPLEDADKPIMAILTPDLERTIKHLPFALYTPATIKKLYFSFTRSEEAKLLA